MQCNIGLNYFLPFFSKSTFSKNSFSNTMISECQTDWIQIRPDILSAYKVYKQTTLVDKELTQKYKPNMQLKMSSANVCCRF